MKNNMTTGGVWRPILFFTLPILGGLLLQQLYATVDGMVVGNFVSPAALGAVGTCMPVTAFLVSLAAGFSTGFGIVFAQFYGAGMKDKLRRCLSTVVIIMLAGGLLFTLAGVLGGRAILERIMGVPEETLDMAAAYLRIYALGMVFQMLYNALAAALRALGDSGATLMILVLSTLANILLDLVFVLVFRLGVAGVAVATVLAEGLSVAAALVYIKRKYPELFLQPRDLVFDGENARLIAKLGVPTAIQSTMLSLGSLLMQRLVNGFGTSMMEAYTAAGRIENFVSMPIIAFNIALATFTGQNMGAGRPDRVKLGLRDTLAMSVVFTAAVSALVIGFAGPLVALFGCTGQALFLGTRYLRFMAVWLLAFDVLFIIKGLLHGAGDVTVPTAIAFVSLVFRVGFAYIASGVPAIGVRAVWYSMAVDFTIGVVLIWVRYLSGRWKRMAVTKAG